MQWASFLAIFVLIYQIASQRTSVATERVYRYDTELYSLLDSVTVHWRWNISSFLVKQFVIMLMKASPDPRVISVMVNTISMQLSYFRSRCQFTGSVTVKNYW